MRASNFKLPLSVVFQLYIRGFSLYHFSAFLKISQSYLFPNGSDVFLAFQTLSLFLFIRFPIHAAPCRIQQSHEGPLQLKDFFICFRILHQVKCLFFSQHASIIDSCLMCGPFSVMDPFPKDNFTSSSYLHL